MTTNRSETEPEIIEMPPRKMAVIHAKGTPGDVFPKAIPALYSSAYAPSIDFTAGAIRSRCPDPPDTPPGQMSFSVGLPVREDTAALPQDESGITLETWQYGAVAQILHLGGYDQEEESVARLMAFVAESGYRVSGDHEEEYLTPPDAQPPKTIIRYQITRD